MNRLGHITILIKDYEEAKAFYTEKMGFEVRTDIAMGPTFRWITVAPKGNDNIAIVFVIADTPEKAAIVGKQAAGHVLLTLQTDNVQRDYEQMKAKGVHFFGEPKSMPYGTEVVFADLYGNRIDLIQVKEG